MRKSEIVFGSIILGVGILLLIGGIFDIDIWSLICPAGLIALGVWLIYRTRQSPESGNVSLRFASDIRHRGIWQAENEEIWGFVLDTVLDFSQADLPEGETTFRYGAFVNEVKVIAPPEIGIAVQSMAFMTETRLNGPSEQTFFIPYEWQSDNFATATKKAVIKPVSFVSEIKIQSTKKEPEL